MSCISPQIEEARRQARKMEVFGQMTVGLAHDLNNMLQGVAGALDVMQTRIDRGQTSEIADLSATGPDVPPQDLGLYP